MAIAFSSIGRTHLDAEIHDIERALRGYGVLTRNRLAEICCARSWREPRFDTALSSAVARGSVKKLSDELYELGL